MPARIQVYCQEHRQPVPQTHAAIARCILESLALEYRWVANVLQEASGKALPVIHIIGGGSRNRLLNQLTADATGRGVIAGPAEATAAGNILAQAISQGDLSSIAEGRQLIRRSFEVSLYEPCPAAAWEAAYQRYVALRPAI
jgi:rhamnulokinase